jgi:hypothetical protein
LNPPSYMLVRISELSRPLVSVALSNASSSAMSCKRISKSALFGRKSLRPLGDSISATSYDIFDGNLATWKKFVVRSKILIFQIHEMKFRTKLQREKGHVANEGSYGVHAVNLRDPQVDV